jgi:hypothetical protein
MTRTPTVRVMDACLEVERRLSDEIRLRNQKVFLVYAAGAVVLSSSGLLNDSPWFLLPVILIELLLGFRFGTIHVRWKNAQSKYETALKERTAAFEMASRDEEMLLMPFLKSTTAALVN